jgi:hypothetical protein
LGSEPPQIVKAFVAVTDNDWFDFLSRHPDLEEVNFWTPSGKPLARFTPGQPVLFKLHAPINYIVGGGFFATFSLLPSSMAWDTFGEMNGAPTIREMRRRIERYRRVSENPREDYQVGCTIPRLLQHAPAMCACHACPLSAYAERGTGGEAVYAERGTGGEGASAVPLARA